MCDQGIASATELTERAVALAEQATKTQAAIAKTQAGIVQQQVRNRRLLRVLAGSVALDILLTITTSGLVIKQFDTTAAIHQSQLSGCAIGDSLRRKEIKLWDHVLQLAGPQPHETLAQRRAQIAKDNGFRLYVHRAFRPVDCARLYQP